MKSIPLYRFHKRKYGTELLIDALDLDDIKEGIEKTPIYRETFYCIILITNGKEEVALNGHKCMVQPGHVICSIPGEIWDWKKDTTLEGLVLIFEGKFLLSFFNDPLFLERFLYLRSDRVSPFLYLQDDLLDRVRHLFILMKVEISEHIEKDQHILRAMLYETLMLLNRAENINERELVMNDISLSRYLDKFVRLVNANYVSHHDVEYYAGELCITPNYLNKIVRQSLGTTAKFYIHNILLEEAKRLLTYTTLTVTEIADKLHFETSSYFIRFFKGRIGLTPKQYKTEKRSPQK